MPSLDLNFLISLVLVALAGILEALNINIGGIKPDIILPVILLASLINKDWWKRIILILIAALTIQFHPGLGLETILFILASVMGILVIEFMPVKHYISFLSAVALGTLIINLENFVPASFLIELIYNLLFSGLIFLIGDKYGAID